jgi:hypothetical protein
MIIENNKTVKFYLGHNTKTAISGKVVKSSFKFVYVVPERISGKFAKKTQKNVLCIPKN